MPNPHAGATLARYKGLLIALRGHIVPEGESKLVNQAYDNFLEGANAAIEGRALSAVTLQSRPLTAAGYSFAGYIIARCRLTPKPRKLASAGTPSETAPRPVTDPALLELWNTMDTQAAIDCYFTKSKPPWDISAEARAWYGEQCRLLKKTYPV